MQPQRELAFEIPAGPAEVAQVEAQDPLQPAWRSVIAQISSVAPIDGNTPAETAMGAPGSTVKAARVALYFDASASASQRDLARERELLQAWLSAAEVRELWLVPFRDVAEPPRHFKLRNADSAELMNALQALPLDGGSQYASLDLAALPEVDRVLILGDGLHNFGDAATQLVTRSGRRPRVSVILAAQRADHGRLQRIATGQGGEVVDLLRSNPAEALASLLAPERRLLSAEVIRGHCEDVLPEPGETVPMLFVLSARCEGEAQIELRLGNAQHSETLELSIGRSPSASGVLAESVHRLRAQQQLARMASQDTADTDAIVELATRHGVVTSRTSLLVLDRIEDYVRYRIAPKEPELRAQYEAALAVAPKPGRSISERDRVDRLLTSWAEFSRWHRQAHPWLETLLPQAAAAELELWRARAAHDRSARSALREAQAVDKRSRELQARWPREGAEPASRRGWEREAAEQLSLLLDLRARREALPALPTATDRSHRQPEDDDRRAQHAPAPPPAPTAPVMAAPVASESPSLDRITVYAALVSDTEGPEETAVAADPSATRSEIQLSAWNPDTPYLKAMRAAEDAYAEYLRQREDYRDSPSFYLDAADHFREVRKDAGLAQRVLSNLAELSTEDTALVRALAHRLSQWGLHGLAVQQFEVALSQRGEEPQSYRDLALALAKLPQPEFARSVELLWKVALGEWSNRFPGIQLIAAHELNDLVARAGRASLATTLAELQIPEAVLEPLPMGLRVVLGWDADNTDIDLWVIDPLGKSVYYGSNRSISGGRVSNDFVQGYGPEVFTLTRPLPGTYRVQANYFSDNRQSLTGPVTVQLEFQTAFGTPASKREATTRRLEDVRGRIDVGEFTVRLE